MIWGRVFLYFHRAVSGHNEWFSFLAASDAPGANYKGENRSGTICECGKVFAQVRFGSVKP